MRYFLIISLFINSLLYADDFEQKGQGWSAWQKLSETILANKEKESIELCSGRMKEGFEKFGMENIIREVLAMKPKFIREFTDPKKETLYLIADVQGRITALIFKKQNKQWLFDEQTPGNFTRPEEADKWQEINSLQTQLKNIAVHVATYFTKQGAPHFIISLDKMNTGINFNQIYTNPQTGKQESFKVVQGVHYKGASDLLLAVNSKAIFGKYYACFEDGHIEEVPLSFIKKNEQALGIGKSPKGLDIKVKQELERLIKGLAANKYQNRKKAKEALIIYGPQIIPFLKTLSKHPDLEVRLSIKEVLQEIKGRPLISRPRYKP